MSNKNIPYYLKNQRELSDQEVFDLLSKCLGTPVYKSVGTDKNRTQIALPVFGKATERKGGATHA